MNRSRLPSDILGWLAEWRYQPAGVEWNSAERHVEEGRKEGVCCSRFLLYEFITALNLQQAYAYSSTVSKNIEPTTKPFFPKSTRIFWERGRESQADAKKTRLLGVTQNRNFYMKVPIIHTKRSKILYKIY